MCVCVRMYAYIYVHKKHIRRQRAQKQIEELRAELATAKARPVR